jgi:galactokinase
LRALHLFHENHRVDAMQEALESVGILSNSDRKAAMLYYLRLVNESGDFSWELLQNLYTPHNPRAQGLALALALTRDFFQTFETTGKTNL